MTALEHFSIAGHTLYQVEKLVDSGKLEAGL
jgi:hypothetical protein